MALTVEMLPGESILILTMSKDFDYAAEGASGMNEILSILDQQTQPIIYIIDMLEVKFSLEDVISAATLPARQTALFHHHNVLEGVIVTQSRLIELATRGMNSPVFGAVKFRVFPTREEALNYARQTIVV